MNIYGFFSKKVGKQQRKFDWQNKEIKETNKNEVGGGNEN